MMKGSKTTALTTILALGAWAAIASGCGKAQPKRQEKRTVAQADKAQPPVARSEPKAAGNVELGDKGVAATDKPAPFVSVSVDPSAPFSIRASRDGQLPADTATPIVFVIESSMDAQSVVTEVRPIDGVTVQDGARRSHGTMRTGQAVKHRVVATAPKGIAGYLAIDVAWKNIDGAGSTTAAIAIAAPGAKPKKRTLGRIEKDRQGNTYEVMKAEMR